MFITLEGIDGSGKSTQAKLLKEYYESMGKKVLLTREPGGTFLAEKVRNILLGATEINDPITELLLFSAGRRDHCNNLIKPALTEGKVVICDRFFDSSIVYQGIVKNLGIEKVLEITELAIGVFAPNITFLIDIEPKTSLNRLEGRGGDNHYDTKPIEFYQQLREGFLELSTIFLHRIKVIDGNTTPKEVLLQIKKFL